MIEVSLSQHMHAFLCWGQLECAALSLKALVQCNVLPNPESGFEWLPGVRKSNSFNGGKTICDN